MSSEERRKHTLDPSISYLSLHPSAFGYGLLLGCIGLGAVVGAAVLPQIQHRIPVVDRQVIVSTVCLALVMIALLRSTRIGTVPPRAIAKLGINWTSRESCEDQLSLNQDCFINQKHKLRPVPSKYCLTISTFASILSGTDTKNDHVIAHGIGYGLSRDL